MTFLETVRDQYNALRARSFATDGYEGVTHAGIAIVALDTGRVFLTKRADDPTDDVEVRETWEFPGGGLKEGEEPYHGAVREVIEETGWGIPDDSMVDGGWRSADGVYQGFRVTTAEEFPVEGWTPTTECSDIGWFDRAAVESLSEIGALRPEVRDETDWDMIFGTKEDAMPDETADETLAAATQVGTAEEYLRVDGETGDTLARVSAMTEGEPALSRLDIVGATVPIHGVLAPEDVESGDGRGFNTGAVTRRAPLRLPFAWQKAAVGGHDGAVTVGSIDRMMRKDGMIHWEGELLSNNEASEFMDLLVHFGRYGVSIDGDKGEFDAEGSKARGGTWFAGVRVAGATGCAIPAFQEAYVALGPHPDMPGEVDPSAEVLAASGMVETDLIGRSTFDRGPGWVTNPEDTKRLHDYWTKPGHEGYAKIAWGTSGDYTRCTQLVGEKIATNSPEDMRFIKRICAQWHHDALGYWPGDLGKPGNAPDTPENRRRAATHAGLDNPDLIELPAESDSEWEAVLVSSVSGNRPPLSYFHRDDSGAALVIEPPDENGFRRTYGYAAQWGVCHVGMNGRCVEPPRTFSDDYPDFHLGLTRTADGAIPTGVLTYGIGHRDAKTILSESPDQAYFDNTNNAWAAVRVGEDDTGIWFSGVVLPGVPDEHIVKIEASGQVSGEWLRGRMRACLTVNVPGYPVERPSVEYDEYGNVMALAAAAFPLDDAPCTPSPAERIAALALVDTEVRMERLRAQMEV